MLWETFGREKVSIFSNTFPTLLLFGMSLSWVIKVNG